MLPMMMLMMVMMMMLMMVVVIVIAMVARDSICGGSNHFVVLAQANWRLIALAKIVWCR